MDQEHFELGDLLIVELSGECYSGQFVSFNKSRTRIELSHVQNYYTNEQIAGVQKYYKREIQSITAITSGGIASGSSLEGRQAVAAQITKTELDNIKRSINTFQYFHHTDLAYYDAITHLKDQSVIALGIEYNFQGPHTVTSLVTVCTTAMQIYMFDVINMGLRIPVDLKDLLEATRPKKIIHNACVTAYVLKKQQNIELTSLCDTLVSLP